MIWRKALQSVLGKIFWKQLSNKGSSMLKMVLLFIFWFYCTVSDQNTLLSLPMCWCVVHRKIRVPCYWGELNGEVEHWYAWSLPQDWQRMQVQFSYSYWMMLGYNYKPWLIRLQWQGFDGSWVGWWGNTRGRCQGVCQDHTEPQADNCGGSWSLLYQTSNPVGCNNYWVH